MESTLDQQVAIMQHRLSAMENLGHGDINAATDLAIDANNSGRADLSIQLLEPVAAKTPNNAKVWQLLGLAYRHEQQMAEALHAFEIAAKYAPQDRRIALGKAQVSLEAGRPAAAQFALLRQDIFNEPQLALALADALQTEGDQQAAADLLADMLRRNPDMIAGHQSLVRLLSSLGAPAPFASFDHAIATQPQNGGLRVAAIRALAQQGQWDAALIALNETRKIFGDHPQLDAIAAYIATETGDSETAQSMFKRAASVEDPGIKLYHIRHCLRTERVEQAASIAQSMTSTPAANGAWPYLSLAWRLLGDDRAKWLDGNSPYFAVVDLDIPDNELVDLATSLRHLHIARQHLPEQSVRGGTQTDKPLFHRLEPEIARARRRVLEAVRDYVDHLPPFDANHPLLGTPRGHILFEGSWSVRLRSAGFHTMHTHPAGWLSSALYVSLPEESDMGQAPAGRLDLGSPPPELGLNLQGYAQVEPKPGRLVLFPSTMWHGTIPFNDGERLTIAFDVRTPLR